MEEIGSFMIYRACQWLKKCKISKIKIITYTADFLDYSPSQTSFYLEQRSKSLLWTYKQFNSFSLSWTSIYQTNVLVPCGVRDRESTVFNLYQFCTTLSKKTIDGQTESDEIFWRWRKFCLTHIRCETVTECTVLQF